MGRLILASLGLLVSATAVQGSTMTTAATQTIPYVHNSAYSALSSHCVEFPPSCAPTLTSCASLFCRACTSLGIKPSIEPCCGATSWTDTSSCFSTYLAGGTITNTASSRPLSTGPSSEDPRAAACVSVSRFVVSCEARTPDFDQLEFSSQSSCICSVNGTNAPTVYDGFWSTCLAWISTADPAQYSVVGKNNGTDVVRTPCEHFATASSAFPTTSSLPTPTATTTPPRSSSGVGGVTSTILELRMVVLAAISSLVLTY